MRKIWHLLILLLSISSCGVDLDVVELIQPTISIELIFPENNSECTEGIVISEEQSELIFLWSDENNSGLYTVHLINIITQETRQLESSATELPIILERGVPYTWFVTGTRNRQSETWSFYNEGPGLDSFIPFPATAVSPVSGATVSQTSTSINLIWTAEDLDADIVGYDVYFGQNADPDLLETDVTESRFNNVPVSEGNTYYWKIVTKDSIGNESISNIFSFTVG